MIYQFKKSLFNNVYWHLEKAFDNLLIRFIWLYGGSSASKTYSVCQLIIRRMLEYSNDNTMVMRKFAVDIKDSIYSDFKGIIELWGLQDEFTCQQNYIVCKNTGSYIRFRGLDDSEKIKGLSNFKRIVLEEISQFDEVDLKQVKKRLRGRDGQQIIGIFNPISEDHWIKTNVFENEVLTEIESDITSIQVNQNSDTIILKTNYTDNIFIVGKHDNNGKLIAGRVDTHVINDFEKDKISDNNYYQIYGLGNWGKIRTGGEFWKDFNSNIHVQDVQWNEDLPIHLSFDENVNPYITCLVWQIVDKTKAIQIDEICLPDPLNRIEYVCNEFKKRYPQNRVKGLFIYGDRTSVKEDTKLQKGENFFTKILQHLDDYRPVLRLPSANPSVVLSGGFINLCFRDFAPINIIIGRNCKKSINDYQYALEDSDGTIKKTKKRNPTTGVTYEEYGHCFVGETMIKTINGEKRIDEIVVGDLVLTRNGYKKVIKTFNNGFKEVKKYKIGENIIECTKNHKIFVNNKFKKIHLIHKGIFCIFDEIKNEICKQKQYCITGLDLQDTLNLKKEQKGFILVGGLEKLRNVFIDIFTSVKSVKSKKVYIFTTKMTTHLIMIYQTLKKQLHQNTLSIIIKNLLMNIKRNLEETLSKKLYQNQKNGIAQKKVLNGIKPMLQIAYFMYQKLIKYVLIAIQFIKQKQKNKNIVLKNVTINTKQEDGELKIVYDIQVEDEHEYFANNILVHNCSDTKRYFITLAFAQQYMEYLYGSKKLERRIAPKFSSKY